MRCLEPAAATWIAGGCDPLPTRRARGHRRRAAASDDSRSRAWVEISSISSLTRRAALGTSPLLSNYSVRHLAAARRKRAAIVARERETPVLLSSRWRQPRRGRRCGRRVCHGRRFGDDRGDQAKPRPGRPPLSLALGFRDDPEARDLAAQHALREGNSRMLRRSSLDTTRSRRRSDPRSRPGPGARSIAWSSSRSSIPGAEPFSFTSDSPACGRGEATPCPRCGRDRG